ncbi:MAG: mechanosensitive ion channel family protein [Stellaceae bacterium]
MADFLNSFPITIWLDRLGAALSSPQILEALALQVVVIAAMLGLCWAVRVLTRPWSQHLLAAIAHRFPHWRMVTGLDRCVWLLYAWLLLAIAVRTGAALGRIWHIVQIASDVAALWLVLRATTLLLRDAVIGRLIATVAWLIFALDLLDLLKPTEAALDALSITIGTLRLSVLLLAKAAIVIAVLLWGAAALSRLIGARLQHVAGLSPSLRVLSANLIRIVLVSVAVIIGLNTVGIDLTAVTVFSGAIGVGVGFGLQKIVSNFVSGIILLIEQSIKPGDVIEVGNTFGRVNSLGARYASVLGRDGKEYLIPNENLITNQVVNWSYSNPLVRVRAEFGVAYASDLHQVRDLAITAALRVARVLPAPLPTCYVTGFGDSSVNLVLRFWINDPADGVTNIKGDVYLAVWDIFHEHGVEFPFPQRDVHLRIDPPAAAEASAAPTGSQPDPAQPERVADDQDRAGAHRRAGDHRVEQRPAERVQDAGRDRHRERVEDEREE